MKRPAWISVAMVVVAFVAGCERSSSSPKGSGALSAEDKALFQYLPSGATGVFGGNYLKLQDFMQSSLGQATAALMDKYPGMAAYMKCFSDVKSLRMASSFEVGGKNASMRLVFTGATMADIGGCAKQANLKTTTDADGKFISIEMPQGPPGSPPIAGTTGYLQLPSGALYSRQAFAFGGTPSAVSAARPELEADIELLAKSGTVNDDAALMAVIAKADRSKVGWFAGDASKTTIGDKVGQFWGSMDITSGLAMEVTGQVKQKADADKVEDGIAQLRKMSDQVPPTFKDVIKNLEFSRKDDLVHFGIKISEAQLKSIMSQFGGMLGAGIGGGAAAPAAPVAPTAPTTP